MINKKRGMITVFSIILVIGTFFGNMVSGVRGDGGDNGSGDDTGFVFTARNTDARTVHVAVDIFSYEWGTIERGDDLFATLEVEDAGVTGVMGAANLPVIRRMIEMPQGAQPLIMVEDVSWEKTTLDTLDLPGRINPLQPPIPKDEDDKNKDEYIIDDTYYSQDMFLPGEVAGVGDMGSIRERYFLLLEIHPVQYNPSLGGLKLMQTCTLRISFRDGDMNRTAQNIVRYSSPSFENLFKTTFTNYGFYEHALGDISRDPEGYLIIVHDDFYDEILPLAVWKESRGFDVTVTNTSSIPGGVSTTTIHNYIETAYDTWPIPPTYLLLVGDTAQIPTYPGTTDWPVADAVDLYYVTMNDEDYFADIFLGRFPAATGDNVTVMVDKTIYYETGNFSSNDWIKKGAFMAGNDYYYITEGTHNYVISTYLDPNNYTCDKLYEETYGATTGQVQAALNEGRSLAIYAGHGGTNAWTDGPLFNKNNVNALSNLGMYPVVCSHACDTGRFNEDECFGETWIRAPDKGGLAFWGASEDTFWEEDDILEKKMFYSLWVDNISTIGGMTDMALYYFYEVYMGLMYSKYYHEAYNILGDPSVKLWRDIPQLASSPDWYDFGDVLVNSTYQTNFEIWNIGDLALSWTLNHSYPWLTCTPMEGSSTGEHDGVIVTINTSLLTPGSYTATINISSNGGIGFFNLSVDVHGVVFSEMMLSGEWNLVSVPVVTGWTAESLGENITGCTVVVMFNGSSQTFLTHVVGVPHDDFPILDGRGYFVYLAGDSFLNASGLPILDVTVNICEEWNIVGWFHDYPTTAESLGENISGTTVVVKFDAETQTFLTHVVNVPHDNFIIERGMAVFIYTSEASMWHGEG